MMMTRYLPALALLLSASGLSAADEAAAPPAAAPEKLICKSEMATGSRTRVKRICLTRADWDKLAMETQKDINDMTRNAGRATQGPKPTGGL